VLVLAEQQNVVPTLPQFSSDPGREDVGAASLKKPAMPEEDPHHLISLALVNFGSLVYIGAF
jgi:hypothetical protein